MGEGGGWPVEGVFLTLLELRANRHQPLFPTQQLPLCMNRFVYANPCWRNWEKSTWQGTESLNVFLSTPSCWHDSATRERERERGLRTVPQPLSHLLGLSVFSRSIDGYHSNSFLSSHSLVVLAPKKETAKVVYDRKNSRHSEPQAKRQELFSLPQFPLPSLFVFLLASTRSREYAPRNFYRALTISHGELSIFSSEELRLLIISNFLDIQMSFSIFSFPIFTINFWFILFMCKDVFGWIWLNLAEFGWILDFVRFFYIFERHSRPFCGVGVFCEVRCSFADTSFGQGWRVDIWMEDRRCFRRRGRCGSPVLGSLRSTPAPLPLSQPRRCPTMHMPVSCSCLSWQKKLVAQPCGRCFLLYSFSLLMQSHCKTVQLSLETFRPPPLFFVESKVFVLRSSKYHLTIVIILGHFLAAIAWEIISNFWGHDFWTSFLYSGTILMRIRVKFIAANLDLDPDQGTQPRGKER